MSNQEEDDDPCNCGDIPGTIFVITVGIIILFTSGEPDLLDATIGYVNALTANVPK